MTIQEQLRRIATLGEVQGAVLTLGERETMRAAADRIDALEATIAERDLSIAEIGLRLEGIERTLDEILAMRAMRDRLEAATGRESSS